MTFIFFYFIPNIIITILDMLNHLVTTNLKHNVFKKSRFF